MLATVATTAAAKPLAIEPKGPPPAPVLESPPDNPTPSPETTTTDTPQPAPTPEAAPRQTTTTAPATDQLGTWINEAIGVLEEHGYPASKLSSADLRLIILHESGGNPNAINEWDGNAAGGTPSKGLMQIISPTFQAYALPGHGDIWNPVDNIIAGTRYIVNKYGSVQNAPGIVSIVLGEGYRGY